jgi:prevent-host-death family protein
MASKRRRSVIGRASKGATAGRSKPVVAGMPNVATPARAWMSLARVSSTAAKNDFAALVHLVERGSKLVVMRHERPAAVMIPVAEFESLANVQAERLGALTARFDAELAAMNAPEIWRGTTRGFMARLDQPPPTPQKKARARAGS